MLYNRPLRQNALFVCLLAALAPVASFAQTDSGSSAPAPSPGQQTAMPEQPLPQPGTVALRPSQPVEDKRAFGVIPNYKTAEGSAEFEPLTVKQKFTIAAQDSFDYPVFATTAFFTGISQLSGDNNSVYGQGAKGFAHRYGIEYADQTLGNFFPEAIIPSLFHDDPRYFRKGVGSVHGRLLYALTRMVVGKSDAGVWVFNSPEIVGNIAAASLASTYHPHERTTGDIFSEASNFWESDAAGNIIKEFWPDVKRHFRKHQNDAPLASGATGF
jgi:hypothetical protein